MRVRVINERKSAVWYWYDDEVGKEFPVIQNEDFPNVFTVASGEHWGEHIAKRDCVIVNENMHDDVNDLKKQFENATGKDWKYHKWEDNSGACKEYVEYLEKLLSIK